MLEGLVGVNGLVSLPGEPGQKHMIGRRWFVPSGPSILIIFEGAFRLSVWDYCRGGSSMLRCTSLETDRGAEPIRDPHNEAVEKGRLRARVDKAGTRNSGRQTDVEYGISSAHKARPVRSIMSRYDSD